MWLLLLLSVVVIVAAAVVAAAIADCRRATSTKGDGVAAEGRFSQGALHRMFARTKQETNLSLLLLLL